MVAVERFVQTVRLDVGVVRGALGDDERAAVGTDGDAARVLALVAAGESVPEELAVSAEREQPVTVGVGDENLVGRGVDADAVRALKLTLAERVTCNRQRTVKR